MLASPQTMHKDALDSSLRASLPMSLPLMRDGHRARRRSDPVARTMTILADVKAREAPGLCYPESMARQRTKPRRYPFSGVCDECRRPFKDFRPKPRVRRRISAFVFCCRAHQLRHWRRRCAAAKQAAAVPQPCNPACDPWSRPTSALGGRRPRLRLSIGPTPRRPATAAKARRVYS